MKICYRLIILWIILPGVALLAQDENPVEETDIEPGAVITGVLNDTTPRQVYSIEGTRGEVIRLRLSVIEGTLDPVMSIFDSARMLLFYRDDTAGTLEIDASLNIERNDTYFVIVSRFAESAGTTRGDFELSIERVGILGEQGSTLRYSVPVTNRISATQPQVYYTFRANAGDILNIDMIRSSGTLDPYLQVVDSRRFVIAENDDKRNSNSHNASIEGLVIEETGTYIVIATRYGLAGGDSAGTFVLTVYESQFSGLSNSTLAPATLVTDVPVESRLDEQQYEQFYTFQAQRDELITLTMERISGNLDAYLTLANAGLNTLIENDDGGAGQNARISEYQIPATGTYYVIASRSAGLEATGSGEYRLTLTRNGSAFDEVDPTIPRLSYGAVQTGIITEQDGDILYAFRGNQGERVTINANRVDGTLDPVVELLDGAQLRMVYDDDSGSGQNAEIRDFVLPLSGVYYIRVLRYEGNAGENNTVGRFNVILSRMQP